MDTLPDINETGSSALLESQFLRGIVRVALARLPESNPDLPPVMDAELWIDRAVEVLTRNIASGRVEVAERYQDRAAWSLLSYAQQVIVALLSEWEWVAQLRRGDSAAWAAVIARLERLAFSWFGPFGREVWAAWEAREVAARTCADLWEWLQTKPYPFDVSFARWSARTLNNRLHETARRQRTYHRFVAESPDHAAFAGGPTCSESAPDHTFDLWLEQTANCEALLQAIAQLDARQARVIRLWYLEGWRADEIAADLGQRVGNVYVLRFRAIKKLQKIIRKDVRLGLSEVLGILGDEEVRSAPRVDRARSKETAR